MAQLDRERTLAEELRAFRETLDALPPAENEEQALVLSRLEALMQSLTRLCGAPETTNRAIDD